MADQDILWTIKVLDELKETDLQLVADFFNQNFPGVFYPKCSPKLFRWKLGESNPAGTGFLTVAISDGKIIGTTSGTCQKIRLGGRLVKAIEIGDTFTHPEFRKKGFCETAYPGTLSRDEYLNKSVFGRLVTETLDRAEKTGVEYVFGTPNLNSRPPYLNKLQFIEIGVGKIKSWSSLTPQFVANTKYKFPVSFFANFLDLIQKIQLFIVGRGFFVTEATFESLVSTVDLSLLDEEKQAKKYDSFSMDQNPAFLKHRYFLHPSHPYQYFRVEGRNKLIGWIICMRIIRQSGRETLVISDWIALEDSFRENLPMLVSKVASKHKGVQIVSLWADNAVAKGTKWSRFGFFSRKDVSIIARSLKIENKQNIREFADFRIGWSDNG